MVLAVKKFTICLWCLQERRVDEPQTHFAYVISYHTLNFTLYTVFHY